MLRCSAGAQIGFGHLRRCLAIADAAKHRGWESLLLLDEIGATERTLLAHHGLTAAAAPKDRLTGDAAGDLLVLDIAQPRLQTEGLRAALAACRGKFGASAFIDALAPESLASLCDGVIDFLVVPYLGPLPTVHPPTRLLAGPEWAPCDPAYAAASRAQRTVRPHADRVLVTFGGADPTRISLKALQAIQLLPSPALDVKIIVGPFFAPALAAAIEQTARVMTRHRVMLVAAPETLAADMLWCDVALAATGLTKYELALTGTPSLQISLDREHAAMNEVFARAGTAVHLGAVETVTPAAISDRLGRLLADVAARRAMAAAGQRLIDGRGTERLLDALQGAVRARPDV